MILMKDIVRDGHEALRKKSLDVKLPLNEDDKHLLDEMLDFVKNSQDEEISEKYELRPGVGISAPQLGVNKNMIAIYFEHEEEIYSYQLVNPKIISHSVEGAYLGAGEGCLSVDETIEGYVPRHRRITVRAYDVNGEKLKIRLKDYPAIVMQHEIDHLNGIMFYDHINEENPYAKPENAHMIG